MPDRAPRPGRVLRFLGHLAVLIALVALAAGTTGDVRSGVAHLEGSRVFAQGTSTTEPPPTTTTTRAPAPVPATTTFTEAAPPEWTLFAGGDVLMDRSEAAGRDPFAQLVPSLSEADIAVVNSEMVVAESGEAQDKQYTFRVPPSAAQSIAKAGIDVVNLGNNHSLDFGQQALVEMIGHYRDAGVAPVGAGADSGEAYAPAIFHVADNRVSVAILGASQVVPPGWAADANPGVASAYSSRLLDAVRAAAEADDVVVVIVHWGIETADCPSQKQLDLARRLVAAGADAVIGSHPHVLQPIVRIDRSLVAYSLGNFAWHSRSGPQADTGILELRFTGDRFEGFTFDPHVIDANGDPTPADSTADARIRAEIDPKTCEGRPPATEPPSSSTTTTSATD